MLRIELNDDYPIKGRINYFEGYMFATTEKHYNKHYSFDEKLYLIDGKKSVANEYSMMDLKLRKEALKDFNNMNKEDFDDNLEPSHYSCTLIDILDDENIYSNKEIQNLYKELLDEYIKFLVVNKRIGVIVPHFFQDKRVTHFHLIYQKDKENEFVNYLLRNNKEKNKNGK